MRPVMMMWFLAGCMHMFAGGGGDDPQRDPSLASAVQAFEASRAVTASQRPSREQVEQALAAGEACRAHIKEVIEAADPSTHKPRYSRESLRALRVTTSAGALGLEELERRCLATPRSFDAVVVHRCGYKQLTITQLSLGGDRWSDPAVEVCHPVTWMEKPCDKKPAADKKWDPSPVGFAAIRDACKAKVVVYTGSSWKTGTLEGGQIQRSVGAECWTEEDVTLGSKEWGTGWGGVCASLFP